VRDHANDSGSAATKHRDRECSIPGEDRHLYATGAAEPSTPCDDTAADADRVPITGALPQSAKGEVPAQLFVLQLVGDRN